MNQRRKNKVSSNYFQTQSVQLVKGGSAYFSLMFDLIDKAQKSIHLQVYIFEADETGRMVAAALKKAVLRNVDVYLLVDGYASQELSESFIKELTEAGIRFRFFEPFFKSYNFYFGRRLHHKVLVTDASFAMVGGINISNRYNDMPGANAWLDFAMYVEGDIATELCKFCKNYWKGFLDNRIPQNCDNDKMAINKIANEHLLVRIARNDWVSRKNQVSKIYFEMFTKSKHSIIILGTYFLPGRKIRQQIIKAVNRGVDVKIIAAGPSDVKIAKYAERWLYDWMLRNKINLYEYQKTVLHGKLAVSDSEFVTVGSYNINNISAYASIELNLAIKNNTFAKQTEDVLLDIIQKDCIPVSLEQHKRSKNIIRQFVRWLSYQLIRILFYLFTFYFKQRP